MNSRPTCPRPRPTEGGRVRLLGLLALNALCPLALRADCLFVLAQWSSFGLTQDVTLVSELGYVADGDDGLRILNLSDPARPSLLGEYDSPGFTVDVAVQDGFAFLADTETGLKVVNAFDPAAPFLVGDMLTPGEALGVDVSGGIAFLAVGSAGLLVADVSNPAFPSTIAIKDLPGSSNDVVIDASLAYVAAGGAGLQIVDVSDPPSPQSLGAAGDLQAERLAIVGDLAYVAGFAGLSILDVSDPTTPIHLGIIKIGSNRATDVVIDGEIAYFSSEGGPDSGLWVADVSVPTAPNLLAHYPTPSFARGVAFRDGLVYVAGHGAGLFVIDPADCLDCPADLNGDGDLDLLDFVAYQQAFTAGEPFADCNADGVLDVFDFVCFQKLFGSGCS